MSCAHANKLILFRTFQSREHRIGRSVNGSMSASTERTILEILDRRNAKKECLQK